MRRLIANDVQSPAINDRVLVQPHVRHLLKDELDHEGGEQTENQDDPDDARFLVQLPVRVVPVLPNDV